MQGTDSSCNVLNEIIAYQGQAAHANGTGMLNQVTASCLILLLPCRINHFGEPARRASSSEGNEPVGLAAVSDEGQSCICTMLHWCLEQPWCQMFEMHLGTGMMAAGCSWGPIVVPAVCITSYHFAPADLCSRSGTQCASIRPCNR